MPGPPLVCLLPARNCASELDAWFASVEIFADAVIALDDGSTDGTGAALRAHPLVKAVLTNPRRDGYEGWDDASNRRRLLDEAGRLDPQWIISLDSDERIAVDDGAALREFVVRADDRRSAYLFRVYRMITDLEHWDRADMWAGRLFGFEKGQRFPDETLHFVPIPTSIPRERWIRSTIRIQHLAGVNEERRSQRYQKYQAVDPEHRFQDSYEHLLDGPGALRRWEPRPPSLPFVLNGSTGREEPEPKSTRPVLSAIIISRDDETRIERAVSSVIAQETTEPFEVIVVVSGTDRTAEVVASRFSDVNLVRLDNPALPGEARNAGLAVATGRFVSFPGSHIELAPGSLEARLGAHRRGYAMVTGVTHNGTETRAGWASYFLDHSSTLPGRPSEALNIHPAHCSYLKAALDWAGWFPNLRAGEDTLVNKRLFEAGYGAFRSRDIQLTHHTPAKTVWRLLRHQLTRGRGLAALLREEHAAGRLLTRRGLRRYLVVWVPARLRAISRNVRRWGDPHLARRFRQSWLLIAAAASLHWLAGWWGYGRGLWTKRRPRVGRS